jgi:solute carrier family 10 (sodium/bile acid cotransporter), member 7
MKIDGFLLAMIAALVTALAAPRLGAAGGPLHLPQVTSLGIAIVFFLHGASLSPKALKAGAANWRLHLVVHATTYGLFPMLGFVFFFVTQSRLPEEVRLGVFYLCALSSTISSSVAMTALGRGNVAGAAFDATVSGLLGMVLTPLLVGLVAGSATHSLPPGPAIVGIMQKMLLPFAIGQIARPVLHASIVRHKLWVTRTDRSVIILIVYGAFCDATSAGIWSRYEPTLIAEIALVAAALLAAALSATTFSSRLIGLSRPDEVAAVFCGSKKSLANGGPIASVLFGTNPALGTILLPLMLYHQLQLVVCSMLARRYAKMMPTA